MLTKYYFVDYLPIVHLLVVKLQPIGIEILNYTFFCSKFYSHIFENTKAFAESKFFF